MSVRRLGGVLGMLLLATVPACEDDSEASTRDLDASGYFPDGAFPDAGRIEPAPNDSDIDPSAALAGACMMMGAMGASGEECTGVDEYATCARDECGLQECLDGDCSDAFACLQDASDACNNDCFASISMECQQCIGAAGMCAVEDCFDLLMCGDVTEGGPCDQLADCCEALPADMVESCLVGARASRAGGDEVCAMAMESACM